MLDILSRFFLSNTVKGWPWQDLCVDAQPSLSPIVAEIIGVHNEFIAMHSVEADTLLMEEGTTEEGILPSFPVGYFPVGSGVDPMKQKELDNILWGALAAYGWYNIEQAYKCIGPCIPTSRVDDVWCNRQGISWK